MKKQLLKKLSAFIVSAMLFSASANAQIVYKDVNPDSTITCLGSSCTKSYNVDLNNDGISDYSISSVRTGNICQRGGLVYRSYVSVSAFNTNAVVAVTSTTYPLAMNFNNVISSGLSLSASGFVYNTWWGNCGTGTLNLWPNSVDRYLGLKLIVGANTYYGWARMQVVFGSQPSFTIKDYAYNSIPNQPIRAGETSCTAPTVRLAASGSLSFCAGDSVTLTANGTGYQYQWKRNGVNIAGANSKTYVAKRAGTYKCEVTNSCGSIISSGRKVTVTCRPSNKVNVEQLESPYELKIAPNPISNGLLKVTYLLPQNQQGIFEVYDLNGRILYTQSLSPWSSLQYFNLSFLSDGLYQCVIRSAESIATQKLMVVK